MSINLSVKNVPDELAAALRARAERNHRSLQGELMALIEAAVIEEHSVIATSYPVAADREARKQRLLTLMQEAAPYRAADRLSRDDTHKR